MHTKLRVGSHDSGGTYGLMPARSNLHACICDILTFSQPQSHMPLLLDVLAVWFFTEVAAALPFKRNVGDMNWGSLTVVAGARQPVG